MLKHWNHEKQHNFKRSKEIRLLPFAEQLQRPQHAEFLQDTLYLIETDARKVSTFDPSNKVKSEYSLPPSIYRGLTIKDKDTVLLTGFVRDRYMEEGLMSEIDEKRTGIFVFSLAE